VIFFSSSQLWNCNLLYLSFSIHSFCCSFFIIYIFGVPPTINCSLFIRVTLIWCKISLMNWPYSYVWQAWINLQQCYLFLFIFFLCLEIWKFEF
jgi:hypothetical protein